MFLPTSSRPRRVSQATVTADDQGSPAHFKLATLSSSIIKMRPKLETPDADNEYQELDEVESSLPDAERSPQTSDAMCNIFYGGVNTVSPNRTLTSPSAEQDLRSTVRNDPSDSTQQLTNTRNLTSRGKRVALLVVSVNLVILLVTGTAVLAVIRSSNAAKPNARTATNLSLPLPTATSDPPLQDSQPTVTFYEAKTDKYIKYSTEVVVDGFVSATRKLKQEFSTDRKADKFQLTVIPYIKNETIGSYVYAHISSLGRSSQPVRMYWEVCLNFTRNSSCSNINCCAVLGAAGRATQLATRGKILNPANRLLTADGSLTLNIHIHRLYKATLPSSNLSTRSKPLKSDGKALRKRNVPLGAELSWTLCNVSMTDRLVLDSYLFAISIKLTLTLQIVMNQERRQDGIGICVTGKAVKSVVFNQTSFALVNRQTDSAILNRVNSRPFTWKNGRSKLCPGDLELPFTVREIASAMQEQCLTIKSNIAFMLI